MRTWICVVVAVATAAAADLPVREVVLYKNGIGYFIRAGELKAGETARLEFKAGEMNDVLKSLVLVDQGGAKVSGIRYDSSEPLERKLADFPFRLGDAQPLTALLDQLKGTRVELRLGPETVAGIILGAREAPAGEKGPRRQELNMLASSGDVRTIDLSSVVSIRFADPNVEAQMKEYLGRLVESRSKEKRSVYIDSSESAARKLAASYVVPAPVWKSSYRLVFNGTGDPMLEGWAVVHNTTGEDWEKVRLALVSGRPVSFISNLYVPKYLQRQTYELPEEQAAAPELHEGVVGGVPGGVAGGAIGGIVGNVPMSAPAPAAPQKLARKAMMQESFDRAQVVASTIEQPVESGDVGELFEYRFSTPITIRKDESAMLPFLQQTVGARKLLIYTGAEEHPRNAAEITNSTGKTLDGGPLTVFEGNTYTGEAVMETLKTGDKRLVSYAVDLGTRITTNFESRGDLVREMHFRRGVLTVRSAQQETTVYTIRNVDKKTKTLVLEHPVRREYKLIKAKPAETTANAYRFEIQLGPSASEKFPVLEERLIDQSVAVASVSPDFLLAFVQNKELDPAARKQLERVLDQKRRIAANDAEIARTDEAANEIVRDEDRVRRNIESLNRVSGQQEQVQNYARQLAQQETALATLRDRSAALKKTKAALQTELNDLIEKIEF